MDATLPHLHTHVFDEFELHAQRLRTTTRERQKRIQMRAAALENEDDNNNCDVEEGLGQRHPTDRFEGDTNLRTLRTLLSKIDNRGYERSPHQLQFHSAFERCTARVIYKKEWATSRHDIMMRNGWNKCSSEVLISTPRRFGKTFSIAIFTACLALSLGCEVVVFSPARRASRKLLERIVEFLRLLDAEQQIVEYNQEQCRVKSYDGKTSLIRSFPSKVGVRKRLQSKMSRRDTNKIPYKTRRRNRMAPRTKDALVTTSAI